MEDQSKNDNIGLLIRLTTLALNNQVVGLSAELLKLARKLWRGWSEEGMYEVLDYQVQVEIKDAKGKNVLHRKREKVRYLQSNIIAYQDQVWGEGEFLVNYRCSPGKAVDRYREGHKTRILISLGETRDRGDQDEFIIEREIHDGYLAEREYVETEISHRTRQLTMQVLFPAARPPRQATIMEKLRNRKQLLSHSALKQLPDGRWQLTWQTGKPLLYERYLLSWEW